MEGSEAHSYVEIDDWTTDSCKDYTLTFKDKESTNQNTTEVSNIDDGYQEMSSQIIQGHSTAKPDSPRYGILLGTIGNDDLIEEDTTLDHHKVVETSVTVNVGKTRHPKPPPNIFRGWKQGKNAV